MKLLIVDDSALMRKYLRELFAAENDIEVVTARNGIEAIAEVKKFKPDVVTLDINMPEMDGLTCLSHIMTEAPCPVVMLSSLTEKGALATLEALQLGAVDFIPKPGGTVSLNIKDIGDTIIAKVRAAAFARVKRPVVKTTSAQVIAKPETRNYPANNLGSNKPKITDGVVLIGVSTGGPRTIEEILLELPAGFPLPIVISQHMPANYTLAMANRLNNACALTIQEVTRPVTLAAGNVYIAHGDADIVFTKRISAITVMSVPTDRKYLWHPSVERMVRSAMEYYNPNQTIAVQLTGMGDDGAAAMADLHKRGGRTIAESEESAVVFGMPKELIDRGGAEKVLHSSQIAAQLKRWV